MRFKARYRFRYIFLLFLTMLLVCTVVSYFSGDFDAAVSEGESAAAAPEAGKAGMVRNVFRFFYFVTFFYFTLNYYYHLVKGYKKTIDYLKVTAAIIIVSFAWHLFLYYFIPAALQQPYASPGEMFLVFMPNIIPMLIFSFLIAYVTNMQEALRQRRVFEAQKLQLEKEKSEADFNFLKAQINPHFLHNTLNFLYAKSLPHSNELSEGILTLSDMMRYALNQGNQKEGKAPLKDEVEHVNNMIRINQLRFDNQLNIQFTAEGSLEHKLIAPLVLITIIENAFKHGDLKNPDHPVEIKLKVNGNSLDFFCRNKKKTGPKQPSTGIGLENIRNRLELTYGEHQHFTVKDEPDFYTAGLTIDQL